MIQQSYVGFQFSGVPTVKLLKNNSQVIAINGTPNVTNVMVFHASQDVEAMAIYTHELTLLKGWCNGCIPTSKGGSK